MTYFEIPERGDGRPAEQINTRMGYFNGDFPVFGLDPTDANIRHVSGIKPADHERYIAVSTPGESLGALVIGVETQLLTDPNR